MTREDLHGLLARLHEELARSGPLDDESQRLLRQVSDDVARLGGSRPAGLEALAVRFEATHPAIGAALRSLVDSLGRAGV